MPAWVADRLKREQSIIADGHADICVMFADIVDFTRLSGRLEPRQVIGFLNHVFTRLDHLCARHGLEKIKTVGDAYMVVGGLGFSGHDYVAAMADMALDIHAMCRNDPVMVERALAFHVGIATGPAVAGVIGATRLSYDVWGDTVNLAARVTEDSAPATILVDRATYVRLSDRYLFEEPREVVYKGTGRNLVFRLVGRRV
jgi:adenylate cyclase